VFFGGFRVFGGFSGVLGIPYIPPYKGIPPWLPSRTLGGRYQSTRLFRVGKPLLVAAPIPSLLPSLISHTSRISARMLSLPVAIPEELWYSPGVLV